MMSGLMFSCVGDIRLYSGTIDGCEQEALLVRKVMWSGNVCVELGNKDVIAHHRWHKKTCKKEHVAMERKNISINVPKM